MDHPLKRRICNFRLLLIFKLTPVCLLPELLGASKIQICGLVVTYPHCLGFAHEVVPTLPSGAVPVGGLLPVGLSAAGLLQLGLLLLGSTAQHFASDSPEHPIPLEQQVRGLCLAQHQLLFGSLPLRLRISNGGNLMHCCKAIY